MKLKVSLKEVHEFDKEILEVFVESTRLPQTYQKGFESDCDLALSKEGYPALVRKPEQPEDRYF